MEVEQVEALNDHLHRLLFVFSGLSLACTQNLKRKQNLSLHVPCHHLCVQDKRAVAAAGLLGELVGEDVVAPEFRARKFRPALGGVFLRAAGKKGKGGGGGCR